MLFNIVVDDVYQNSLSNRFKSYFLENVLYNHTYPFIVSSSVFGMLFPGASTKQLTPLL